MYIPADDCYEHMKYRRCGRSGILLPAISLGLWHNFGDITPFGTQQSLLRSAFDHGITHFDLANNYGPPYGEAERNFGRHMLQDWKPLARMHFTPSGIFTLSRLLHSQNV